MESAATIVDGLTLHDNGNSGVHIDDARYVYLSNLSSFDNGDAGLEFNRANDIESGSGVRQKAQGEQNKCTEVSYKLHYARLT